MNSTSKGSTDARPNRDWGIDVLRIKRRGQKNSSLDFEREKPGALGGESRRRGDPSTHTNPLAGMAVHRFLTRPWAASSKKRAHKRENNKKEMRKIYLGDLYGNNGAETRRVSKKKKTLGLPYLSG